MSVVKSNWNGNIMITGDSKIDLLASIEIQKRYIEVLETYDLNNHILKATRIGKKLIDHIISNIQQTKFFIQMYYRVRQSVITTHPISLQTCLLINSRQDTNT